jgi:hypothetical protein
LNGDRFLRSAQNSAPSVDGSRLTVEFVAFLSTNPADMVYVQPFDVTAESRGANRLAAVAGVHTRRGGMIFWRTTAESAAAADGS